MVEESLHVFSLHPNQRKARVVVLLLLVPEHVQQAAGKHSANRLLFAGADFPVLTLWRFAGQEAHNGGGKEETVGMDEAWKKVMSRLRQFGMRILVLWDLPVY